MLRGALYRRASQIAGRSWIYFARYELIDKPEGQAKGHPFELIHKREKQAKGHPSLALPACVPLSIAWRINGMTTPVPWSDVRLRIMGKGDASASPREKMYCTDVCKKGKNLGKWGSSFRKTSRAFRLGGGTTRAPAAMDAGRCTTGPRVCLENFKDETLHSSLRRDRAGPRGSGIG
jgi:hypothetical protein